MGERIKVDEELLSFPTEPGVVRNQSGRIIETGWPRVGRQSYPTAVAELETSVKKQIKLEKTIVDVGYRDVLGTIRTRSGVFNLGGATLVFELQELLSQKMKNVHQGEVVEVCDVGGGNGFLLERGTIEWTNINSRGYRQRNQLETTLTTLIKHDEELLDSRKNAIDNLVEGMGIELPQDNFFERFDAIVAQNSVFFWSQYPELALRNLYKMSKPGGSVLVTIPTARVPVYKDNAFDMEDLISGCEYFDCAQIKRKDGGVAYRLEKK